MEFQPHIKAIKNHDAEISKAVPGTFKICTVHTIKGNWTSQSVHTFNADFYIQMGISKIGYF